jgi:hypothetical protein
VVSGAAGGGDCAAAVPGIWTTLDPDDVAGIAGNDRVPWWFA